MLVENTSSCVGMLICIFFQGRKFYEVFWKPIRFVSVRFENSKQFSPGIVESNIYSTSMFFIMNDSHTHTSKVCLGYTRKGIFQNNTVHLVPFTDLWSRGCSPKLDIYSIQWLSCCATEFCRHQCFTLGAREAECFCVLWQEAFSPIMHISLACASQWSGFFRLDGSLVSASCFSPSQPISRHADLNIYHILQTYSIFSFEQQQRCLNYFFSVLSLRSRSIKVLNFGLVTLRRSGTFSPNSYLFRAEDTSHSAERTSIISAVFLQGYSHINIQKTFTLCCCTKTWGFYLLH